MSEYHDVGSEQELLGAVLVNNAAFAAVESIVRPEDFFEPLHRDMWTVFSGLISAGKLCSPSTIRSFLPADVMVGEMNVRQYVAALAAEATTIVNAPDFARVIRDLADRRLLIEVGVELQQSKERDNVALSAWAVDYLDGIVAAQSMSDAPAVDMRQAVDRAVDAAAIAFQRDGKSRGVSYGLGALDEKTLGAMPGQLIVMAGRPGMGKFQPLSSPVLTPTGWRDMGSMRVGDEVVAADGSVVSVAGVFPQGEQDVFRVNFADGRSTLVGLDHLWEVRSKHWKSAKVIDTREIVRLLSLVRYKKWLHVPLFCGRGIPSAKLPVAPYTLGAWLGDGSVGSGRITKPDEWIFDRIRDDGYLVSPEKKTRTVYRLIHDLRADCVAGFRSWDKTIPEQYFWSSYEQRLALLNGLLDTDGTVEPSGTLRYATSSPRLAGDVQRLVRSVGGLCKIHKKKTTHRDAYILTIRHANSGSLISMPRKVARMPARYQYADRLGLRIESVEFVGRDECQCISIDHPSGLYVTDDYTVTHNTALALGILRNMAEDGNSVMIWSGEMGDVDLTTRMISDKLWSPRHRLTYWQIASGKYREDRFHDIKRAGLELAELPIRIEQQPGLTVAQIGARARQWKRKHGLKALFLDHLGLIKASGRYSGNKVYETGEITGSLKTLAKELGVPVFLLCQINRGVEQRDDKRPALSDLRNSGDIEQDADTVMMLYRPAYYLAKKEPHPGSAEFIIWTGEMEKVEHRLDVGIEKQRSGPVGTVRLHCDIASNAVRDEISEMDDSLMLPGEKMGDFA